MRITGPIRWFERLLAELGHELWIGDAAKIRASEVRKQKTDERDARLILDLLLTKRFPKIWVPPPAGRDKANGLGFLRCRRATFGTVGRRDSRCMKLGDAFAPGRVGCSAVCGM